jgi:hypothetical protein
MSQAPQKGACMTTQTKKDLAVDIFKSLLLLALLIAAVTFTP